MYRITVIGIKDPDSLEFSDVFCMHQVWIEILQKLQFYY
jgi:hypothetical protein